MVKIKSIKRKPYKGKVYDITLQNNKHPYFYANDILTHNSLYPHIMIQCNLYGRKKDGLSDERETWFGGDDWKVEGSYYSDELADIGKLLARWYTERLHYKKIGDKREYTIKIIINIIYGILNTIYYSLVYDKVAGGDCTRIGRQWVKYARTTFKKHGYTVIYTDSVGKNSNIRTNKGNFKIKDFFSIGTSMQREYKKGGWSIIDNKEIVKLDGFKTITMDDNYNVIYDKIKYVIRHKTKKKMYRIWLNCYEYLDVTEDHSLIWFDDDGKLIEKKPLNAKNVICLQNIPDEYTKEKWKYRNNETNPFLRKELLQLLGFWFGDGNLSKANEVDINLSTGKDTKEFIKKVVEPLSLRCRSEKNNYDIKITNKPLYTWMKEFKFTGTSKTKKIPELIFNLDNKQIGYFLSGFCSADGSVSNGSPGCGSTNEKLIIQIRNLFYKIGIRTTMKRDFKPNHYNGVIAKIPTYNFWLTVLDRKLFKEQVGFIFDRKQNKINDYENRKFFATKQIRDKIRRKNNKNYKGELVYEKSTDKYINVPVRQILKIEEIQYNDYVYDIETEKTGRFYANDILVHNTDSVYIIDVFNDKEKMLKVKDEIINYIKSTVPFPQDTFDMGIDDEITHMFFFKGKGKEIKVDSDEMDDEDFINKPKGFMKKNYAYVAKVIDKEGKWNGETKIKIKNLGIVKKSVSPLSRKIFWDHLVPQIKEHGEIKYSKTFFKNLINELLTKDMSLAMMRKDVGPFSQYKMTSPGSLPAQIAKTYGPGIHFLIPNISNVGVGKSKSYCTLDEFKSHNLNIDHIDLKSVWSELDYFIKPMVTKNIFDYVKK